MMKIKSFLTKGKQKTNIDTNLTPKEWLESFDFLLQDLDKLSKFCNEIASRISKKQHEIAEYVGLYDALYKTDISKKEKQKLIQLLKKENQKLQEQIAELQTKYEQDVNKYIGEYKEDLESADKLKIKSEKTNDELNEEKIKSQKWEKLYNETVAILKEERKANKEINIEKMTVLVDNVQEIKEQLTSTILSYQQDQSQVQKYQSELNALEQKFQNSEEENKTLAHKLEDIQGQKKAILEEKENLQQDLNKINSQYNEMLEVLTESRRDKPSTSKASDKIQLHEVIQKIKYYKEQLFHSTSKEILERYLTFHPSEEGVRKEYLSKIKSKLVELLFKTPALIAPSQIIQDVETYFEIELDSKTKQYIVELVDETQKLHDLLGNTDPPGEFFFIFANPEYDPNIQQIIPGSYDNGTILYVAFPGLRIEGQTLLKADVYIIKKERK